MAWAITRQIIHYIYRLTFREEMLNLMIKNKKPAGLRMFSS